MGEIVRTLNEDAREARWLVRGHLRKMWLFKALLRGLTKILEGNSSRWEYSKEYAIERINGRIR
jgi:hypothetical protein